MFHKNLTVIKHLSLNFYIPTYDLIDSKLINFVEITKKKMITGNINFNSK